MPTGRREHCRHGLQSESLFRSMSVGVSRLFACCLSVCLRLSAHLSVCPSVPDPVPVPAPAAAPVPVYVFLCPSDLYVFVFLYTWQYLSTEPTDSQ